MDLESMNKLRMDRRLTRRRRWIDAATLARELESLPDAAAKAAPIEDPEEPTPPSATAPAGHPTASGTGAATPDPSAPETEGGPPA